MDLTSLATDAPIAAAVIGALAWLFKKADKQEVEKLRERLSAEESVLAVLREKVGGIESAADGRWKITCDRLDTIEQKIDRLLERGG